jgi:hypothetical protein
VSSEVETHARRISTSLDANGEGSEMNTASDLRTRYSAEMHRLLCIFEAANLQRIDHA